MTTRKRSAGRFFPLGATLEPEGVNFALYSKHATEVSLLLFDREDGEPTEVIRLENRLEQDDGRGPTGKILPAGQGDQLLEFRLVGNPPGPGALETLKLCSRPPWVCSAWPGNAS